MSFTNENVDRLSSLPEDILPRILSLLPTKSAVRTCILSKRWRCTWVLIHNLDFDDDSLPPLSKACFPNIVERMFNRRGTAKLNTFRLKLSNDDIHGRTVSKLIGKAITLSVCELDIDVKNLELPSSIFTCKTLRKLRLHYQTCRLGLIGSTKNAFKGCPSLETLSLTLYGADLEVYNFIIPSLKRLEVKFLLKYPVYCNIKKIVLNVSNLEHVFVGGNARLLFVVKNMSSLDEAKVLGDVEHINLLGDHLEEISGVKSLYLSFKYQYWRDNPVFYLPNFPNLKYLEFKGDAAVWNFVHKFLESSSELEHLSIEKLDRHWYEPKSVPTCMLMNLKTIEYDVIKASECNINFLKFMLGNSKVLKMLTVKCRAMKSLKGNERFCATLSALPRASRDCQLQFI